MNNQLPTIAVLLTCHNRKANTLRCLRALMAQYGKGTAFQADVFLVDDGSTDGTAEAIAQEFPTVQVIAGDGNLFWNRGMHLAWKTAAASKNLTFSAGSTTIPFCFPMPFRKC